jgi:hypothetical protein
MNYNHSAWNYLYNVVFTYSRDRHEYIVELIELYGNLHYCAICKFHWNRILGERPEYKNITCKDTLISWLVDVENDIRILSGKNARTVAEAVSFYSSDTPQEITSNTETILLWVFIIIIVTAVIVFIIYYLTIIYYNSSSPTNVVKIL